MNNLDNNNWKNGRKKAQMMRQPRTELDNNQ